MRRWEDQAELAALAPQGSLVGVDSPFDDRLCNGDISLGALSQSEVRS